ncbi:trypsin-like serine protease [Streptomyces sp. NPDC001941]|uniref:trypsin-like serine protease n=1 Tax=Streptomyces sp. NPDC001941 TaxID=3154659 RepID=UPI0033180E0F
MISARSRLRTVVSAAAVALALGGAALSAVPAQAADGPVPQPGVQRPAVSERQARQSIQAVKDVVVRQAEKKAAESGGPEDTTPTPQIIGGGGASISEAPWMVQLFYDNGNDSFFCGGTLVAANKVLTAAHCVAGSDWASRGTVLGGTATFGDDAHGTVVGVSRQWSHPSYSSTTYSNDVAVLTLSQPLPYKTLRVTRYGDTGYYGKTGTVYGWGLTASNGTVSPTLKKANLAVQSDATCTSTWGSDYLKATMLCAGNAATGSDSTTTTTCSGDSGGPLVYGGRIVGVVSWGARVCSVRGARSVFARAGTFTGLINPRVDDANLDGDAFADVYARTAAGADTVYRSNGTGLTGPAFPVGPLTGADVVRQSDINADGYGDYVYRTASGELHWWGFDKNAGDVADHKVGTGWGAFRNLTVPGDVTNDGFPDLVANDAAGALWLWSGRGDGTFNARVKIGSGWASYQVYGKGDYSGDGVPDLLARDAQARLWVYKGTGNPAAPFSARVQVGSGWNFTAYVTTGDLTGDGRADFAVRDAAGAMWAYKGTGSATTPFITSQRIKIGSGWNGFTLLG